MKGGGKRGRDKAHANTFIDHYRRHVFVMQDTADRPDIKKLYEDNRVAESKIRSIQRVVIGDGHSVNVGLPLRCGRCDKKSVLDPRVIRFS